MKSYIIILFLILSFEGCKKFDEPTSSNNNSGVAIPLKVGNFWVYKIKVTHYDNSYTYYDTLRVVEYNSSNNLYKIVSNNGEVLPNGYYQNTNNGFCSGNQILFKFPAVAGDTSYSKGKLGYIDKDGIYVYFRFKQYNIGIYDDYSVYAETEYNYIQPNVGLVMIQWATNTRNYTWVDAKQIDLQSYNIK